MARLMGFMANRRDRLAAALHQERSVVRPLIGHEPANAPVGWGVGFYQGGEILHKKRPQVEPPIDWVEIAGDVETDCAVLHARLPTVGDFSSQNTHPFRMRRWLFAHTGTIDRFDAVEESLRGSLPDFLTRNIRGTTDSEVYFHVILSFLHDAGHLDNPDADPARVISAMRSAVALIERLSAEVGGKTSVLNCVLTNGRSTFAMRHGAPMVYVERRGLHDPPPDLDVNGRDPHAVLRYVMVASDVEEAPREYTPLEEGQIAVIGRDLDVRVA